MVQQNDSGILVSPYGGTLVNLLSNDDDLVAYASTLPRFQLSARSICDLELLATGGFSPLDRFMGQADYQRVVNEMRLARGTVFPIPITLPLPTSAHLGLDKEIALADTQNNVLAVMRVEEIYQVDIPDEARMVAGTDDLRHPLVAEMHGWSRQYVSGPLRVLRLPQHFDFRSLRMTPEQVRQQLGALGHGNVVAFQTRNPLHRAHEELTVRAAEQVGGALLLHPVVGITRPGDIDHFTRVRSYKVLADRYYDRNRTVLSLLPLAMRMAGPREALWHAIIRRNFGANHLIVGRDHASPGKGSDGRPFYDPTAAQELVARHSDEIGVKPVAFSEMVYIENEGRYEEASRIPNGAAVGSLSGTQVRDEYLRAGRPLPEWFTRPEVAAVLSHAHPPRYRQGFCIWFTGLSGAGKSTTAEILALKLLEKGRQASVLDGDVVRTHLSKGLGFSKEDRDTNIRRIGFVASEVVRHGGAVICAAVSPYRATRNECRSMIGSDHFIEVFVDTPLDVCEQRDTKGMYAMARAGRLQGFTGVDDPYEAPHQPEITLDTVSYSPDENADRIIATLVEMGFFMED